MLAIIVLILLAIILIPAVLALESWVLMLLLGAVASITGFPIAFGFWACVVFVLLLNFISGFLRAVVVK